MDAHIFQSELYVVFGAAVGSVGGWLFHRIWRHVLPLSRSREFWRTLPADLQGMLRSAEPDEMLGHYRTLLKSTAGFAGRNSLAVLLGIAPTAILFLVFDAFNLPNRVATDIEFYPATAVTRLGGVSNGWRVENERLLIDRDKLTDSPVRIAGRTLNHEALARKRAFCETTISCLMFDIMLFETDRIRDGAGTANGASIVLRPRLLDSNPFWPFLDDLDFWFFIGVMLGSATAAWRAWRERVA